MAGRKRCRHDIAARILEVLAERSEARTSQVALEAGLAFDRARKLLASMEKHGLVYYNPVTGSYGVTSIGYEWLFLYRRLEEKYSPPSTTPDRVKRDL